MNKTVPKLTIIPANPELAEKKAIRRQLRVAAYCRVSTDSEEQMTSYEAQKTYYTDKIMQNPQWSMAGIFADEGITGMAADTANILPQWRREHFREQSWQRSTP